MTEAVLGRSARKRATILSAGRALFLGSGYQGTNVDQIAASAEVSKQTVYKHFGDKQELLLAIVNDALESTVTPFSTGSRDWPTRTIWKPTSPRWPPTTCGRCWRSRSCIAQARDRRSHRVPALAQLYYEQAPSRALAAFADCIGLCTTAASAGARTRRCRRAFRVPVMGGHRPGAVLRGPAGLAGMDVDRTSVPGSHCFSPATAL